MLRRKGLEFGIWSLFGIWGLGFGIWSLLFAIFPSSAQTNSNLPSSYAATNASRAEQIRSACVEGRRYVSGKVLQITTDGLIVDSGYPDLLNPPFNKSW